MGDHERCASLVMAGAEERQPHTLCTVLIERRGGFIEQQQRFGEREGSCQKDTLTLSAREFGSIQREKGCFKPQGEQYLLYLFLMEREFLAIMRKAMRESNEECAILSGRLQFLRNIGRLLTNLMDVMNVQGEPTDLDGTRRERHKAQDGTQQGGLATTALAGDSDKLASVYREIEAAK